MNGSVTVAGQVLEVAHRSGEYEGRAYNFHVASVLCGTKVVEVKFQADNGDARPPAEGDTITLAVEVPKGTKLTARRYMPAVAAKSA